MHDAGSLPAAVPTSTPAPGRSGAPRSRMAAAAVATSPLSPQPTGRRVVVPCRGPA